MVDIQLDFKMNGPLLEGMAPRIVAEFIDAAQREVAAAAQAEVHLVLDQSIKQPTPYYETQITTERQAGDVVVHDRGIVYGPWLEGVSERNRRTRFKGYAAFRRSAQRTQARVPQLVAVVHRRMMERLGEGRHELR
jgi:hypothetical protein